jgi:outer membrane lipoprotein LolB
LTLKSRFAAALICAGAFALGACGLMPMQTGSTTTFSGRLVVQVESAPPRRVSAEFDLSGDAGQGRLELIGPMGVIAARAQWRPGQALLETPEGRQIFADSAALADAALGEAVPVFALFDWLRGRPWPAAESTALADSGKGFEQLGWRIDLGQFDQGRVVAVRNSPPIVTLRVFLEPRP